eukprot:3515846-Pyramimonas_sp.AAC.1
MFRTMLFRTAPGGSPRGRATPRRGTTSAPWAFGSRALGSRGRRCPRGYLSRGSAAPPSAKGCGMGASGPPTTPQPR